MVEQAGINMASVECRRGEVLSNSTAPNVRLRVYTDREWDSILEDDILETRKIPLPTYDVWRCPNFQRSENGIFERIS